jgi:hypothetical protein
MPPVIGHPPITDDPALAMESYGIQCIPVNYFHWNGFRYGSLKDAIAAARRARTGVRA